MTLTVQTCRTAAVTGSGAVGQALTFTFPFTATSEIVVKTRVTATGVEATLAETTDYTVSAPSEAGGTVTTVTAIAATKVVYLIRVTPKTQATDLVAGGDFAAETIEDALDKVTKLVIEARDTADRSLRMPDTDATATASFVLPSVVDRASKYLTFDASGLPTATATVTPATAITLSAFGASWGVAVSAAAGRTLLGLGDIATLNIDTDEALTANSDGVIPTQRAVKTYADTKIATASACALTGNQTVAGIKTFSSSPIVPTPTTDYQAATKLYVDENTDQLSENCSLLSTTTLNVRSTGATNLYTVPTGKRCILSHAIIVCGAAASTTALVSFGSTATSATSFLGNQTLTNLAAQYDAVICQPIPSATPVKTKSYAAADVIKATVATADVDGSTDAKVFLFGTIYTA